MKDLLTWWFLPKRAKLVSSIIKILIGLLIVSSFFSTLIGNVVDFIDALRNPPLYIEVSYLLLPIIFTLFIEAIFWGGWFYLPYCIFGKRNEGRKRYLIPILLVVLIIGSFFVGGVYTKPDTFEITRTQLALLEAKLGEVNKMGEIYTLQEFGYDIAKLTKPLPDFLISEAGGFSKLVLFYKDCEKEWKEYEILPYDMESAIDRVAEKLYGSDDYYLAGILWSLYDELPNKPISIATKYRLNHPEVDASLLFWGKVDRSVFRRGSSEGDEVMRLLRLWWDRYGITPDKRPKATWLDLKD